jgi:hypothetical protein
VAQWSLATLPLGGMGGTVNLTVDGLSAIPGAAASFSPASIGTSGASIMTLNTSATTPAGTYPVTIIGNDGNITHTVAVSVVVPKTSVRLSTTSLTFSAQKDGTVSSPQNIIVTNTGRGSLSISPISMGGNFKETNTCGSSLKAGGSCTVSVSFAPKLVGAVAQHFSIKDSDPTSPQSVLLAGTGLAAPDVQVSPTTLGFSLHKVGTSTMKTTTLNNRGSGALTISKMTVTGADQEDFSQTNNCGGSLAAGSQCTVTVTFKPSAKSTRVATLSIYDDNVDNPNPQTVSLKGAGQ